MDRVSLSKEHAELDALAVRLLAEVDAKAPGETLSALRWRLNHVLMVHLAKEDKVLYPRLLAKPETRALAQRFASEMGDLAKVYLGYASKWTIERIQADWQGFGEETREVMAALRRRILREERDLYPRITETATYTATSASMAPCKM
ncbi:hemerythrin domain-containing protein [Sphingomonas psychrolutea]|uniref:Hemerythrin-like domain-containing protein n=1 Tax=Sphingomonas psychrolutea TaxID=1259676 RepID=A0ABQ1G8E4_9SPHN|nr:hemerythrin domain-containing protein [Sphingomonas psychrolutea]GGA38595.1 hypothetical protein GCM10011395_06130 [Sphingomonas psychrolutea]